MKIDRLETHDRLKHLHQDQWAAIAQGADDCMTKNPLSLSLQEKSPYIYIFAHPRTDDQGRNKRLLWQPRIVKPKAQENSFLFRAKSKTDILEIIWIIPEKHLWKQYQEGNVTESKEILWSISQFINNRENLEKPDPEDLPEEKAKEILLKVIQEHQQSLKQKNYTKLIIKDIA